MARNECKTGQSLFRNIKDRLSCRVTFGVGSILALVTLLLYWPTSGYQFIIADDYQYVTQNPNVLKGLSWGGVNWALWSMYADNWHPMTWVSHMLDCSLYGLFPGGHHLTNVFFHTANTVLLFLLLKRLTGSLWPSAFVAALFAWHPVHVESVAWICERKDVLSTFFLLLTIGAYARYVARPTRARLLWALLLFLLGLMSKPMLVTLPCLLLLLDYWPLNRLRDVSGRSETTRRWFKLVVEKTPFFFLSMIGCVMTVMAQSAGNAVKDADEIPLLVRLANPICSYGRYLVKAIWPEHLVIFYPLPATPSWGFFAGSLLLILAVTGMAFLWRTKFPWLVVGWCWFLGTLVPVIGLVQVGNQAMADRYTYIPYIGLFIAVVWSVNHWMKQQPLGQILARPAGVAVLMACCLAARIQLGYWRDSIDVFGRATALTRANPFSNGNLNYALAEARRSHEGIPRYEAILRPKPDEQKNDERIIYDTASVGRRDDAVTELSETLRYDSKNDQLYNNLGIVMAEQGKLDEAMDQFEKAIQLNPKSPWPRFNEAVVLQERGNSRSAIDQFTKALELHPVWPEALDKEAFLLAACPTAQGGNPTRAIELSIRANELTGSTSAGYLRTLANAYASAGSFSNAVSTGVLALQKAQSEGFQAVTTNLQNELESYRYGKTAYADWQKPRARIILSRKNEVLPP